MAKTALITGVSGQDGSYLAELLLSKGYQVVGTSHREARSLGFGEHSVPVLHLDLSNAAQIQETLLSVQPDEIYHLASRSSSAQLFDDPWAITDVNALSTLRFMEAMRQHCVDARFVLASSSEVFAAGVDSPQSEATGMFPANAYGAAKAYARHLVAAYRQQHGLKACTAILFNHESPRRGAHYVTRKITRAAAAISLGLDDRLVLGSLESQRDWCHARDVVRGMWLMLQQESPQDMVLASGKVHTVRDVCELAFSHLGLQYERFVSVIPDPSRRNETVLLRGDSRYARAILGWQPEITFDAMLREMVDADLQAYKNSILLFDGKADQ